MMIKPALFVLLTVMSTPAVGGEEPRRESPAANVRTLETITIEGAVDLPRVMFITSRDNVRYDDGLGWSYLPGVDEILADVEPPTVVASYPCIPDSQPDNTSAPTEPASPEPKE
ncbi:MAG: hypothetical protein GY838_13865 [bacterium]|nr:hypothetical protein [bacterium]